jgi:hypothetical protein
MTPDLDAAAVTRFLQHAGGRLGRPALLDNVEALRARLAGFAADLEPCPPPELADGFDLCPCGTGVVWPCRRTRAAWAVRGLDRRVEIRRAFDAAIGASPAVEEPRW